MRWQRRQVLNCLPVPRALAALFLFLPCLVEGGGIFTNPLQIRKALIQESAIIGKLRELLPNLLEAETERELRTEIHNYLDSQSIVEQEIGGPVSDVDPDSYDDNLLNLVAGDPLHMFKFTNRVARELPDIVESLENLMGDSEEIAKFLSFTTPIIDDVSTWPDIEDLTGTIISLCRIKLTWDLPVRDFANGQVVDHKSLASLSIEDLIYIADDRVKGQDTIKANNGPEYAIAIEFLEVAYQLLNEDESNRTLDYPVKERLIELRELHDQNFMDMAHGDGPSELPDERFFIEHLGNDLTKTGRMLRDEEERVFSQERWSMDFPGDSFYYRDYYRLCRGLNLRRKDRKPPNTCYFTDRGNPFLKLQPLKVEVLMDDPRPILVYHDVVSDTVVDKFKAAAISEFARATMVNKAAKVMEDITSSNARTQSSGWLHDADHTIMEKLSRYFDHVTGLQVSRINPISLAETRPFESESFQIGIYSPGGLYMPHMDAFDGVNGQETYKNHWIGNRIATGMIYLSDVPEGGRTAFPKLGVAATPSKGSMVYWYNLLNDLSNDQMSLHGGCPTARGIKWVSNKWIRDGAQIWKKPCLAQDPKEPLRG